MYRSAQMRESISERGLEVVEVVKSVPLMERQIQRNFYHQMRHRHSLLGLPKLLVC